jgi:DNA-directed RNA polymerase subunit M/transcription elongation factor TFIIS
VSIKHHVSYSRDETIIVCESCHAKIHHSKDSALKAFLPEDKRPQKPKSEHLILCPSCQHNKIHPASGTCRECKSKTRSRTRRQSGGRTQTPVGPSLMVTCKKCGTRFEGRSRTTCPKCREFFR